MNLNEFFETNSTSLEVIDVFEDYCEEKSTKKAALNAAKCELCQEYFSEKDQYIIVLMTIYYCGLRNNLIDEKIRNELEHLTKDSIFEVFGEIDGKTLYEVLEVLLKSKPTKPQRKKIDYSNPGSKNWNVGDIYAYSLSGKRYRDAGIEGQYMIIYCLKKDIISTRTAEIVFYMIICRAEDISMHLNDLLKNGIFLKSDYQYGYYRFRLISSHHEYPTDNLIYLGNVLTTFVPDDEILAPNSFFQTRVTWRSIESDILSAYRCYKKYNNSLIGNEYPKNSPDRRAEEEIQKINAIIERWKKDNNINW